MQIDILSLFPKMFEGPLNNSIIGKAQDKNLVNIDITNFRDFTLDKQNHVDDNPYGGGVGMLLQAQPIFDALDKINYSHFETGRVILLDPAGSLFNEQIAKDLSKEKHLTFICGHYEGYDERIRTRITDEISIGDYILTGGELAAMIIIDAIVRLIPGVLGNRTSAINDSFSNGLLESPQYTRPFNFRGLKVPEVLVSGDHKKIFEWRHKEALKRTYYRRPDLLKNYPFSEQEKKWMQEFKIKNDDVI